MPHNPSYLKHFPVAGIIIFPVVPAFATLFAADVAAVNVKPQLYLTLPEVHHP